MSTRPAIVKRLLLSQGVAIRWRPVISVSIVSRVYHTFWDLSLEYKMTLAGLEPAIFGSEEQRLIH